jgi:hypothetical protein
MAKVFGIHHLELKNGVDVAEFERIVSDEFNALPKLAGWESSIVKGERGNNVGQYMLIFEAASLETRNRDVPGDGRPFSPELQKWYDTSSPTFDKISSYLTTPLFGGGVFTDYVVVGR